MKVITSVEAMQRLAGGWKRKGKRVVLVPTMGALHAGHIKLLEIGRKRGDILVASIYVNPTQFGPKEDFSKYPRPRSADLKKCRAAGVDAVFAPSTLYAGDHSTWVTEESLSLGRDGGSRPDHFRGVTTVVLKLFNAVQPVVAIFGQKDAQQADVIRRMVRDLNVPVRIEIADIVRDRDGLALSSRNVYLSPEERDRALALPLLLRAATLQKDPVAWLRRNLAKVEGIRLDYAERVGGRLCAAVYVGKTRLIDNVGFTTGTRTGAK